MPFITISAPAVEPISVDEAKLNSAVDGTEFDAFLEQIAVPGARERAEHETGRRFITQTLEMRLDKFPSGRIEIPTAPVQEVVSIVYIDTDGSAQTVGPANYRLDTATSLLPGIEPAYGFTWPSTRLEAGAVRVQFIAGYGDNAAAVPAALRQWMLLHVGTALRNRESFIAGVSASETPNRFVDGLLDRFRLWV